MQTQNELLLLSDFMKFLKQVYSAQFWDNPEFYYKAFNKWKSDNNIASVEPEPLAKNKDSGSCYHSKDTLTKMFGGMYCDICKTYVK